MERFVENKSEVPCDHQNVVGTNSLKGPELACPRELYGTQMRLIKMSKAYVELTVCLQFV